MVREILKKIAYRSLWRVSKKILFFFMPFLLIFLLTFGIVLSIFGAGPSDNRFAEVKKEIAGYVNSIDYDAVSKYGQENGYKLDWGIVFALEMYANGWRSQIDMDRVKRMAELLKPEFEYTDYTEKRVRYTISGEEIVEYIPVKILTQVHTYKGIYSFEYKEITEKGADYEYRYLEPVGVDFLEDYSKLDAVIYQELKGLVAGDNIKNVELSGGKMLWPAPSGRNITSPFGWRLHPVLGVYSFHTGIDIGVPQGSPVIAVLDGVVRYAGELGGYGRTVILDHGNGITTLYAHNSELKVKKNDVVRAGSLIAYSGSTGRSTGPHLHFEVRVNGRPVDPLGNFSVGRVQINAADNIDRKMIVETAEAFMKGQENLEFLIKSGE